MNEFNDIIKKSVNEALNCYLRENNSRNFEEWFSDNGLCGENGKPLMVYHGSGKRFKNKFDIGNSYDGKHCFTADKKAAMQYTRWNNYDDNWRTINSAWEYLENEGYELNNKLSWPENLNLLSMVSRETNEPIDEEYAYNVIRHFYEKEYNNPTLYSCYLRNAEKNDLYDFEYNVFDDDDVWIVKIEPVEYKPIPTYPDMSLNTYIE